MNRRALDRARARSLAKTQVSRNRSVGTNLGARTSTVVTPPVGAVRNRRGAKMTGAQRDSRGERSAWADSPYVFTDPKWDQTLSSQHVGTGGFR